MKKLMIVTAMLIAGFLTTVKAETKIINHSGFEFGFFYSNLAPYGTWIELDAGLVVWRPTIIRRGWSPYRHGRWMWTVDGWYWDSYEPFGHIVFHYGRWYYDDYYGWIWIPDYEWAPAWVEWRYDNDYIGWAPLPPYAVFSISIGIHYTHNYYVPYHHWHYVTYNRFCDPYVYNYYVAPKYKYRIHNRTKVRHNYGYRNGYVVNRGVDIDFVRKRSGQNIRQRDIVRVNDYRDVEKYRGKDDNVVRTFVASRDQINKSRSNDVKIKKENRRSTLDVSKVRIGRDNVTNKNTGNEKSVVRNNDSNRNDVIIKERNTSGVQRGDVRKNNEINKRTEVKKETNRNNKTNVQQQRNDVKRKEVDIRRNNDINRQNQVNKENVNNNRTNVQQQRKEVQRKDVNTRRNTELNRQIQVRKQTSDNNKTNVQQQRKEVQRKDVNIQKKSDVNRKTQVRTEQNRSNSQNKTKTQDRKVERKNNSGNTKERKR